MHDPRQLPPAALEFLAERHHALLTTLRADGSPHVVAVGFTFAPEIALARVITFASAMKARHAARGGRAALGQVDGARWISLEGDVRVTADPGAVADAVERYAQRYRQPGARTDRVVIEIAVDRVLGSGRMLGA